MKAAFFSLLIALALPLCAQETPSVESGGLTFAAPSASWKVKETPAAMSQGGFTFTAEGKSVDADIFFFGPGQGGDIEANVARWKGRFEGEPTFSQKSLEAGDKAITLVIISGTYLAGSSFGPKTPTENQTLLGAIVPGAEANVFLRMVGDAATVKLAQEEFEKLLLQSLGK